jgi:hypothetical protein
VQPEAYQEFRQQVELNEGAGAASELYGSSSKCSHRVLKCPSQVASRVTELQAALSFAQEERKREKALQAIRAKKAQLSRRTTGTM